MSESAHPQNCNLMGLFLVRSGLYLPKNGQGGVVWGVNEAGNELAAIFGSQAPLM